MKKSLSLIAVAAMSLTACTQSDVIEESVQSSNAIGFNTMVNKGSRAIESNTFKQFNVYGNYYYGSTSAAPVEVFTGTSVTRENTADGTPWTYTGKRYWIKDANYYFSAYAIDGGTIEKGTPVYTKDDSGKYTFSISDFICDHTQQKDLVYAAAGSFDSPIKGKDTQNDVVPFAFKHVLSRLDFVFKTNFPKDFKVTISKVTVQDVRNKATFTGKQYAVGAAVTADAVGAWSEPTRDPVSPYISVPFEEGANMTIDNTVTDGLRSGFVYVIPFHYKTLADGGKGVAIQFNILVKDPSDNEVINKQIAGRWRPMWDMNKTYTYTVNINGEASGLEEIQFSGSVGDWETGTPANPSFDLGAGELPSIEPQA